ncbi:hypothetical protein HK405_015143, partial [Cladochytrium tenue]
FAASLASVQAAAASPASDEASWPATTRALERKGTEYRERLAALAAAVPPDASAARFDELDALRAEVASATVELEETRGAIAEFAGLPHNLEEAEAILDAEREELARLLRMKNDLLRRML